MVKTGVELVASLRDSVQEISVQSLYDEMQLKPASIVIDIRERAETDLGCVPNVALIPRGVLEMQLPSYAPIIDSVGSLQALANEPIYLLCRSGARSVLAAHSLQSMGFNKVYSVAGGYLAWQAAGYPVSEQ